MKITQTELGISEPILCPGCGEWCHWRINQSQIINADKVAGVCCSNCKTDLTKIIYGKPFPLSQ